MYVVVRYLLFVHIEARSCFDFFVLTM